MSINNIVLSSADRKDKTTDASNCELSFNSILEGEYFVKSLSLTNTIYNVDSTNNVIYFNEAATNKTATITPGYYSASDLAAAAATAMTTASGGANTFTASYSTTTKKTTFASNSLDFSFKWSNDLSNNGAHEQLGFNKGVDTAAASSITAPNIVNLTNPLGVFVTISNCFTTVQAASNYANGSLYVPITVAYGEVANINLYNYPQKLLFNASSRLTSLKISITDEKGKVRSLNGGNFALYLAREKY